MNIKCVIDSSTLISLAKINALELLGKLNFQISCPAEVYSEAVEMSIIHGYYEGLEIRKLFDKKAIAREKVPEAVISGISKVDSKVVNLAKATGAIVLANDTLLARNARMLGIEAFGSADILLLAKEKNIITASEFESKLTGLVKKNRLSAKNAEEYKKG